MTTIASLGRNPSAPDPRDFRLADFLAVEHGGNLTDPLSVLNAAVQHSWEGHKTKAWIAEATARLVALAPAPPQPAPDPGPQPPAMPSWLDADDPVLDQQQTPHCVGFTGADWLNALPTDDHVSNDVGDAIYQACKNIDGEPGQENGSTIRSLAKALVQRSRLKTYAFASTIDEVLAFVENHGPICWGIGWTDSMFTPDDTGLVVPSGADVGGHAFLQYGVDRAAGRCKNLNHWGESWGQAGRFDMTIDAMAERLANGGEAMAGVELP